MMKFAARKRVILGKGDETKWGSRFTGVLFVEGVFFAGRRWLCVW